MVNLIEKVNSIEKVNLSNRKSHQINEKNYQMKTKSSNEKKKKMKKNPKPTHLIFAAFFDFILKIKISAISHWLGHGLRYVVSNCMLNFL